MILVVDNIYIEADLNNFMVFESDGKVDKKGFLIKNNTKYYTSLETLFSGLSRRLQRRSVMMAQTLEELGQRLREDDKTVRNAVSRLTGG